LPGKLAQHPENHIKTKDFQINFSFRLKTNEREKAELDPHI